MTEQAATSTSTSLQDDPHLAKLDGGEVRHVADGWAIKVHNNAGTARSHIHLSGQFQGCPPEVLFAIFCYPDNSSLFRDIQRVGKRSVVTTKPGLKIIEVEQLGELHVLWIRRQFSTWLRVTEDARDSNCLVVQFDLMHSDVLAQFGGRWELKPQRDATTGVVSTGYELHQEVLPKGVPPFMRNLPVMGDLLRGMTMRAIRRIMEDVQAAVLKIQQRMGGGMTLQGALRELCGACAEEGHANGAVASFALTAGSSSEDDEPEGPGGGPGPAHLHADSEAGKHPTEPADQPSKDASHLTQQMEQLTQQACQPAKLTEQPGEPVPPPSQEVQQPGVASGMHMGHPAVTAPPQRGSSAAPPDS